MSDDRKFNTDTQPAVKFIETLSQRIFDRVIRGDYNYETDVKTLRRYQQQAQKLQSKALEARILNNLAVLQNVSGRSTEAVKQLREVFHLYEALDNKVRMATTLGNLSTVHITQGNYEEATTLVERAMALISPEEDYSVYRFLLGNRMSLALVRQDYEKLDALFEQIKAMLTEFVSSNKTEYARYMSGVYQVMAERELARNNMAQARSYINLATEFAEGLSLTFELAEIYCTHAHIVLERSEDRALAEEYWDKMRETLKNIQSPSHIGRHYIVEARYLLQHGYPEKAEDFAQRAINIFERFEMPEDVTLAQQLLRSINEA